MTTHQLHHTDEDTSRAAIESHTATGKRDTNCKTVLKALKAFNYSTAMELYRMGLRHSGIDYHETVRRLNDLRHQDLVDNPIDMNCDRVKMVCRFLKKRCILWRVKS